MSSLHILLVADGRSPITKRWLDGLFALNYRVSLISSHPCATIAGLESLHVLPIAFSRFSSGIKSAKTSSRSSSLNFVKAFRSAFQAGRYILGPFSVQYYSGKYRSLVEQIHPDLVHALRIPYEGMLARFTPPEIPMAVSIWGNDLTLHATHSRLMREETRKTLQRANGLHTDTNRDIRLAHDYGFPASRPELIVPGNGGIDLETLDRSQEALPAEIEALIPAGHNLIINPRGLRTYTRTDTFFTSIPLILHTRPKTAVLCASMAGEPEAERWLAAIHADQRVVLLPPLSQAQLWSLFRRCPVSISVTMHDGTPNTLLEAMSCGSFPVAGDIEPLHEWIRPGENGLLVDPGSPQELAAAVIQALNDSRLREQSGRFNREVIKERADASTIRPQIDAFYKSLVGLE